MQQISSQDPVTISQGTTGYMAFSHAAARKKNFSPRFWIDGRAWSNREGDSTKSVVNANLRSGAGGHLGRDALECRIGVGADCLNSRQTDDDDQGQHHRVFDGCRAVLTSQKTM